MNKSRQRSSQEANKKAVTTHTRIHAQWENKGKAGCSVMFIMPSMRVNSWHCCCSFSFWSCCCCFLYAACDSQRGAKGTLSSCSDPALLSRCFLHILHSLFLFQSRACYTKSLIKILARNPARFNPNAQPEVR